MDGKRLTSNVINAVRNQRIKRGWDIPDLARAAQQSVGTIILFEKGTYFAPELAHCCMQALDISPMDIQTSTTGERVRVARYAAGFTQTWLAKKIGDKSLSQTILSQIELDKTSVKSLNTAQRETLANILQVSAEWLYGLEPEEPEQLVIKEQQEQEGDVEFTGTPDTRAREYIASVVSKKLSEQGVTETGIVKHATKFTKPCLIKGVLDALCIPREQILRGFPSKTIGDRIAIARLSLGIGTEKIADTVHVNRSAITAYELCGKIACPMGELAKALEVSTEWLATGNGNPLPEKAESKEQATEPIEQAIDEKEERTELFDITVTAGANTAGTTFKALSYAEFLTMLRLAKKANNIAVVELHE